MDGDIYIDPKCERLLLMWFIYMGDEFASQIIFAYHLSATTTSKCELCFAQSVMYALEKKKWNNQPLTIPVASEVWTNK